MNTTVMAERQAKALMAITAEVARLGGRMEPIAGRAPNPQVKHTLTLEAVAAALAGIGAPGGAAEVEPVEAVIAVVTEPTEATEQPAPKRKAKEPTVDRSDPDNWMKSGRGKEAK